MTEPLPPRKMPPGKMHPGILSPGILSPPLPENCPIKIFFVNCFLSLVFVHEKNLFSFN